MLGKWLERLTPEQEDRLLTQVLVPFIAIRAEGGGCLVGVAGTYEWGLYPGHWPIADLLAAQRRDAHVHRLGNLTLVTKKLNPSMSNAAWARRARAASTGISPDSANASAEASSTASH